jgi:hypothetical protein
VLTLQRRDARIGLRPCWRWLALSLPAGLVARRDARETLSLAAWWHRVCCCLPVGRPVAAPHMPGDRLDWSDTSPAFACMLASAVWCFLAVWLACHPAGPCCCSGRGVGGGLWAFAGPLSSGWHVFGLTAGERSLVASSVAVGFDACGSATSGVA